MCRLSALSLIACCLTGCGGNSSGPVTKTVGALTVKFPAEPKEVSDGKGEDQVASYTVKADQLDYRFQMLPIPTLRNAGEVDRDIFLDSFPGVLKREHGGGAARVYQYQDDSKRSVREILHKTSGDRWVRVRMTIIDGTLYTLEVTGSTEQQVKSPPVNAFLDAVQGPP